LRSAGTLAAGVPMAIGSDVGSFPYGTQAREFVLMVKFGMSPLAALQAGTPNGAKLLGWQAQIGALKPGYDADIYRRPRRPAPGHLRLAKSVLRDEKRRHLPQVSFEIASSCQVSRFSAEWTRPVLWRRLYAIFFTRQRGKRRHGNSGF
jgi:Amidohydrolase family